MADPRSGRPWRRARAQVLAASTTCWLCGKPGATTVDHVIPISKGGPLLDLRNLRPAHQGCNSGRGNRPPKPRTMATPPSRQW